MAGKSGIVVKFWQRVINVYDTLKVFLVLMNTSI